jgi:ATP-dependent Lon protease
MPGKILQGIVQVGCSDPVLMIDEIDKLGRGWRGDPSSALLEVLDPEQNRHFVDHYVGIPFDLSRVMFIATANVLTNIPEPLRDRMEILRLSGYTEQEKIRIGSGYLLPALLERMGLAEDPPRIARGTWVRIIREYTLEAGVRNLRREAEKILRKVATARVAGRPHPREIRPSRLERYLGPPRFVLEESRERAEVGVATGLAWTPAGGDLLTIEALAMRGRGELVVTGHLGDVMKESVRAAHSFVRSRAERLEIEPEAFERSDIHIHFPEGAVAKDGPSAGVAVTLALASLMSRRPVRHDIAVTGEITLQGRVLPIGGVKEKVLAAHRARIPTVILPRGNAKDLAGLPDEIRSRMRFLLVESLDEVLEAGILSVIVPADRRLASIEGGNGKAARGRSSSG